MTHFSLNHHNRTVFGHNIPGTDYYSNTNSHYNTDYNEYHNNPNIHNNNLHQLSSSLFNQQQDQLGTGTSAAGGGGSGGIDYTGGAGTSGSEGGASLGLDVGTVVGVVDYVPGEPGFEGGPRIVAMDQQGTQHQEAYYLFFVGSMGMILNIVIVVVIFLRRPLRRMTSAFLVHASFLNLVKAAFCIPFGLNLLSDADATKENQPPNCVVQGSSFIVLLTTSAFNMVAMICTEAYTFGETNVGGNSQGTTCCILFGVLVVYITAVILHLGPTLIGGDIVYNPDIGSCAFRLGETTGYVANVMCIVIITFALAGVAHFLSKFYKEIQMNRPNRVSMLVRHSISITDDDERHKESACAVHEMTQDAIHRAKIFVITAVAFVLCWYPLFILIVLDVNFSVSPKVYQAFCFIAWSHPLVEPIILIFFDRNLNILSKFMYCDQPYTASQIAYLLSQHRDRSNRGDTYRSEQTEPSLHQGEIEDLTSDATTHAMGTLNSHNISMEIENAFQNVNLSSKAASGSSPATHQQPPNDISSREISPGYGTGTRSSVTGYAGGPGDGSHSNMLVTPPTLCQHCHSPTTPHKIMTSSSSSSTHHARSMSSGSAAGTGVSDIMVPVSTSSPRGDNLQGFQNFQPLAQSGGSGAAVGINGRGNDSGRHFTYGSGRGGGMSGGGGGIEGEGIELNLTSLSKGNSSGLSKYDPVCMKDADGNGGAHQGNIQC